MNKERKEESELFKCTKIFTIKNNLPLLLDVNPPQRFSVKHIIFFSEKTFDHPDSKLVSLSDEVAAHEKNVKEANSMA